MKEKVPNQVLSKIWDTSTLPVNWFNRQVQNYQLDQTLEKKTKKIIVNVAKNGDSALIKLTERYDKVLL